MDEWSVELTVVDLVVKMVDLRVVVLDTMVG